MHRLYISTNLDSPICRAGTVVLDKLCWEPKPIRYTDWMQIPGYYYRQCWGYWLDGLGVALLAFLLGELGPTI